MRISKHANRTTNNLFNICGDTLSGVFRIISLITPLVFSVQSLPMSPLQPVLLRIHSPFSLWHPLEDVGTSICFISLGEVHLPLVVNEEEEIHAMLTYVNFDGWLQVDVIVSLIVTIPYQS